MKLKKEYAAYLIFSMRKVVFHFNFTLFGLILGSPILKSVVAFSLFLYFAFSFLNCNGIFLQRPNFHFTEPGVPRNTIRETLVWHLRGHVIPWVGNLTGEKCCVSSEISGMVPTVRWTESSTRDLRHYLMMTQHQRSFRHNELYKKEQVRLQNDNFLVNRNTR
jgi:hypothetical protein